MAKTLRSIFEHHCRDIPIDAQLVQKLQDYANAFVNKNPDHVSFFGGALIGVYTIRWTNSDTTKWYEEILTGVDENAIRKEIVSVPGIDASWIRGADETNHSMLYLLHALHHSTLSEELKIRGQYAVLAILHYKFLCSLMYHYFPIPAAMSIAQATYIALSKKFDLKVAGSWSMLLNMRADSILDPKSVHGKTIRDFGPTDKVIYMITDIQGRLRSIVKNITAVFYQVKDANQGVYTDSSMLDTDEGPIIKDTTSALSDAQTYLSTVIIDPRGFIKSDLLRILAGKFPTSRDWLVMASLKLLSERYGDQAYPDYKKLCEETLLHAFDMLTRRRIRANDYPLIIDTLKKTYMASRETNPVVINMRKLADRVVLDALPPGRSALIAPDRAVVMLYIVLRTLTKKQYR